MRRASSCRVKRPRVRAATAGPKTSPTTPIRLFAIITGQKVGRAKITAAVTASTASEDCLKPSFFGAVVTGSVRQQCRADRQQQRGRHHEHSEFEEHGGADVQSLAAKCGEPQNGRE